MVSASKVSVDEIELPYRVECSCGNEAAITREDVESAVGAWSLKEKVGDALVRKGWWEKRSGWICPQCFEALE
jgi:hypothetical protein